MGGRALRLAWVSSIRQPARTGLGILGVAAVGALLFDMLLLSRGLVVSFRDLLDREGFNVRVMGTDAAPVAGPRIVDADRIAAAVSRLPEVEVVVPVLFGEAEFVAPLGAARNGAEHTPSAAVAAPDALDLIGTDPRKDPVWTVLDGRDLSAEDQGSAPVLVNRSIAAAHQLKPGSVITLRGRCGETAVAMPPASFTVVGIAEFPFDDDTARTVASRLTDVKALCSSAETGVDLLLVRSHAQDGGDAAATAIRAAFPELYVVTNSELVERFSRVEFSYFRQISFALATITLFFGFLLIAVLLTASVNQRLGDIAMLRAVGLSRARVTAGVLAESAIMVGIGALLAVPAGLVLSTWLDQILRRLPGIPTSVHFFVFEPRVLLLYTALLVASAVGAALYPMRIIARLPIAATLRREVVG